MTHNGDALSRFRGVLLQDVTSEQLDAVLGPTSLTPATADQLEQANLIAQAVAAQRTAPHGMPIHDSGDIVTTLVGTGEDFDIQPPGTEVWRLTGMSMQGAGGTGEAGISYYDGSTQQPIATGLVVTAAGVIIGAYGAVSDIQILNPIFLTNAIYWKVLNTGLTYPVQVIYSYQLVSR